jgi:hypothetical protein
VTLGALEFIHDWFALVGSSIPAQSMRLKTSVEFAAVAAECHHDVT